MEMLINQTAEIFIALYQPFIILALFVSVTFVVSGFTDLFIDLYHIGWNIRRFLIGQDWPKLTLQRLESREQQKIAIFIAAWQESAVIAQTLNNATATIRYKNYDIFVGTYPNDPDTQREVDKVARDNPHIHKVITPDDGPTNKASNLNHVFNALLEYEKITNRFFDIILMHDAEDVIHSYSLLVYNYLIPRMEMVQIPVFPMVLPLRNVTHWTYADEFAENHTKILRIREITGGFVPSAGVGTAFTKRAFHRLAIKHQEVFSPNSLTEDYQLGLRMNLMGMKAAFVNVKIPAPLSIETGKGRVSDWVATRAVFPTKFKQAVKQKTRWNIGIVLQGWENLGWKGSAGVKWNLLQDRKTLVAAPVNFLAYFVFVYFLLYNIVNRFYGQLMPVLITEGSFLAYMVIISTILMVWRSFNRAYSVNKVYGFLPAITSIPRAIWGNGVNFFAITRAVFQYIINKFRRREVAWDKTSHEFPAGVTEEGKSATAGMREKENWMNQYGVVLDPQKIIRMFIQRMAVADDHEKIKLLENVSQGYGEHLFPHFIRYISDPSWEVRAAVCRLLSFLCLPQAIPHLKRAASDPDWVVRNNAVRALGKLGEQGEDALMLLLHSKDLFSRDTARTVLEHQGFLDRRVQELHDRDPRISENALQLLKTLSLSGGSQLAQEILEEYSLDESKILTERLDLTGIRYYLTNLETTDSYLPENNPSTR